MLQDKPEPFRRGQRLLSERALNALRDAIPRAIRGLGISRHGDRITINNPPRQTTPEISEYLVQFVVIEEFHDYLIGFAIPRSIGPDGNYTLMDQDELEALVNQMTNLENTGPQIISVAKPYTLQREPLDNKAVEYDYDEDHLLRETYRYDENQVNVRTVERVKVPKVSSDENEEETLDSTRQLIYPPYIPGSVLTATRIATGGKGQDELPVDWLDMNESGRTWQEIKFVHPQPPATIAGCGLLSKLIENEDDEQELKLSVNTASLSGHGLAEEGTYDERDSLHKDGQVYPVWYTAYHHLSEPFVRLGDFLSAQAVIGQIGTNGETAAHLHFSLGDGFAFLHTTPYVVVGQTENVLTWLPWPIQGMHAAVNAPLYQPPLYLMRPYAADSEEYSKSLSFIQRWFFLPVQLSNMVVQLGSTEHKAGDYWAVDIFRDGIVPEDIGDQTMVGTPVYLAIRDLQLSDQEPEHPVESQVVRCEKINDAVGWIVIVRHRRRGHCPRIKTNWGCGIAFDGDRFIVDMSNMFGNGLTMVGAYQELGDCPYLEVNLGCGLDFVNGGKIAVDLESIAGVGLSPSPVIGGCPQLDVNYGCGLSVDFDNSIYVDRAQLIGLGLVASIGTGCSMDVKIGCGLTFGNSGEVNVKPSDLAGDGLEAANSGCALNVKPGCGIVIDDDAVAVDMEAASTLSFKTSHSHSLSRSGQSLYLHYTEDTFQAQYNDCGVVIGLQKTASAAKSSSVEVADQSCLPEGLCVIVDGTICVDLVDGHACFEDDFGNIICIDISYDCCTGVYTATGVTPLGECEIGTTSTCGPDFSITGTCDDHTIEISTNCDCGCCTRPDLWFCFVAEDAGTLNGMSMLLKSTDSSTSLSFTNNGATYYIHIRAVCVDGTWQIQGMCWHNTSPAWNMATTLFTFSNCSNVHGATTLPTQQNCGFGNVIIKMDTTNVCIETARWCIDDTPADEAYWCIDDSPTTTGSAPGGCGGCSTSPTGWTVSISGFTGCMAALNGTHYIPNGTTDPASAYCFGVIYWPCNGGSIDTPCMVAVSVNNQQVTVSLMAYAGPGAAVSSTAQYMRAWSPEYCCYPFSLPLTSHNSPYCESTAPGNITVTPICEQSTL